MESFKNNIRQYHKVSNEIDRLKTQRAQIRDDIVRHIKINPELKTSKFSIGDHVIQYQETSTKEGLSQKLVKESLTDYFKDPVEANRVLQMILSRRSIKSKYETISMRKKTKK